jgi:2-polyprenyl-3-methyl-5-hydroxy-6-metoxy-1,4-benzoquinol methylase
VRHVACDVCGADDAREVYLSPAAPGTLHTRYVRCRSCGLVYADPRADPTEAAAFYGGKHGGSDAATLTPHAWNRSVAGRLRHLQSLPGTAPPGTRFVDVGFGDGASLAAALQLGWNATGLELDPGLVEAARVRVPAADVRLGDVVEFQAEEPFDVAYSWHTVEHVLDVGDWLDAILRLLAPGGVFILGTENAASAYAAMWTAPYRVARRVPRPPTSSEHTYWFEPRHLEQLLVRRGYLDVSVRAYENSAFSVLRGVPTWRPFTPTVLASKAIYLASSVVATLAPRLGGKIVCIATAGPPR